ncbi:hypothetical protein AAON49_02335 [Pseudotenacibaculum sp. MALMAid0570]|uniref:hypothetical protein n=1 Tax=Pseudotenacibaculum sp. MALMAid0570 TaxID=3143938 RepID=UPI0032DEDC56
MKKIIAIIFMLSTIINYAQEKEVNTKPNRKYRKHQKGFYGKLNKEAYQTVMDSIEFYSGVKLSRKKKLYVNFRQKGENCVIYGMKKESSKIVFSNIERISKRITKKYDTQNLLLFDRSSFFKDFLLKSKRWKLAPDFFEKNIFTKNKICEAFIVIRPNGEFYKYYGEDHFSIVETLLKSDKWEKGKIVKDVK